DESVLFAVARKLLEHVDLGGRRVRLAGLAAANLVPAAPEQLALFAAARESATRRAAAARAVDELARRFGADVVRRRLPREGLGRVPGGHSCGRLPSRYKSCVDPELDRRLHRFRQAVEEWFCDDLLTPAVFG